MPTTIDDITAGAMIPVTMINADTFQDSVFFSVSIHKWGNQGRVTDAAKLGEYLRQLDAERQATPDERATPAIEGAEALARVKTFPKGIKVAKQLLKSQPLEELGKFLTESKAKVCGPFGVAAPSHIKDGLFVLGKGLIPQVENDLKKAVAQLTSPFFAQGRQRLSYVETFLEDYENAKSRAKNDPLLRGGLGALFDPRDYPPAAKVAGMFSIDWQWLALGVPDDLPEELRNEANAKFTRQMNEAAQEVKDALRVQLGEFVSHLVEKLTVKPGEKPQIFRDTLIENIAGFCEVFNSRNIMRDGELAQLVDRSRALIAGVSADKLRKFGEVRDNTRQGFETIKAAIDGMLTTRASRRFDLE